MKIALVGNDYLQQFPLMAYGGIEASVEAIADGLFHAGCDFTVITPSRTAAPNIEYPFEVIETPATPTSMGSHKLMDYIDGAAEILRMLKPEIVWAQSFWGAYLADKIGLPCIATIHDWGTPTVGWFLESARIRYRFVSAFQRDQWATTQAQRSASFVQHHGLRADEYGPHDQSRSYHLFVGGLSWGYRMKGLDLFVLKAIEEPGEEFVIYGTGNTELERYLERISKKIGNLHFMGALTRGPQHRAAFSNAKSTFMMTRLPEAFGRVTIESLACGTPVWGSTMGALPEVISAPRDGQLFMISDIPPDIPLDRAFDYQEIASAAARFSVHLEVAALIKESQTLLANQ
jgi:glycosyltransferase involved in cell wall biosynthesis